MRRGLFEEIFQIGPGTPLGAVVEAAVIVGGKYSQTTV